jgi:hypothetical protein
MHILSLLVEIPSFLSQFESYVLLISPLAITSSLPRVSLDLPPFFVVLIPLSLLCFRLLPYVLVYYRLWPLWYWGFLPNCLLWTYPWKVSPFFQPGLRTVSYPSPPWFLPNSCHLTSSVLIPSFVVCFICYHHYLFIHRSCFDTYIYSCSLKKISSLPPQFESGGLPIRPLDVPSHFFICRSYLNSILYGTNIFCLMLIYLLSYIFVRYFL